MLNQNISTVSNPNVAAANQLSMSMTDNIIPRGGKKDNLDDFEELSESHEIIEDRIFRLKLQMIDLTITQ